jgi:hypothetical protein
LNAPADDGNNIKRGADIPGRITSDQEQIGPHTRSDPTPVVQAELLGRGLGRCAERFQGRQPSPYEELEFAMEADAVRCTGVRRIGSGQDLDSRLVEHENVR